MKHNAFVTTVITNRVTTANNYTSVTDEYFC